MRKYGVVSVLIFVFGAALIRAQVAAGPVFVTSTSQASFDHTGKDTKGGPETLASSEFVLTAPVVVDLNASPTAVIVKSLKFAAIPVAGTNTVAMKDLLAGVPDGAYKLWVRVYDLAGNVSVWSAPASFSIDQTNPVPPGNVKVTVTISVGP